MFSTSISAQVLSVGVMGGLPLTDAMKATEIQAAPIPPDYSFGTCLECATQRTVPYLIGAAVEARLKGPFSLEVGALYSRADFDHTTGYSSAMAYYFEPNAYVNAGFTSTKNIINRWEFPVLGKYRFPAFHRFEPFVEGGISIQYSRERQVEGLTGAASGVIYEPLTISFTSSPSSAVNCSVVEGATIGIGASYVKRRIRPFLEIRYTRWFDKAFTADSLYTNYSSPGSSNPQTVSSTLNQAQLLLGIVF
jgi:hypothetical protein